jgi:hypothetical protein
MVQELNQSNIGSTISELNMVNTMLFRDRFFNNLFSFSRGEYRNLLLQEHIAATAFLTSPRLYFDEGTSTPT